MPRRRWVKRREEECAETVKTLEVDAAEELEAVAQATTTLESTGKSEVTCVISLRKFILAGGTDGNVRVYDRDTSGGALGFFAEHNVEFESSIVGLAPLKDDLVVSVDDKRQLFTWRPSNTEAIGSWEGDEWYVSKAVARLDESRLVVGTDMGNLLVLSHCNGANLKIEEQHMRKHNSIIDRIFVSNDLVVSCSEDKSVKVWNKSTFDLLAALSVQEYVGDVTVSDTYIVLVCMRGRIYVHRNSPPYVLEFDLQTPCSSLYSATSLNSDIVAIADSTGCVSFVSLAKRSLVARVRVSYHKLYSLAVLSDNRIAAAGVNGCTLFCPPPKILHAVIDYTTSIYDNDATHSRTNHPILDGWNAVQRQSLALVDACEAVINSENTARSLDEWCVAHDLLMQAVKSGIVPASRDYNGTKLHWHLQLYQHCDKLAIGEKDVDFLISLFREAEDVGVIGEGTAESFISDLSIRNDIEKDKWHSANAIYNLFLRQIETDERLQKVLHYQKVQQLTSVINAILCFVPIGGSMAANVLSGGAAIFNDFQVCGVVESLLGVSKELGGGFGSSKLVDLFLRRSNEVLSEEHWDQLEKENRLAVEDAAQNLGLTVEELRVRLLRAAEMDCDGQENNQEERGAKLAELLEEREAENCGQSQTSTTETDDAPAITVSNSELTEHDVNAKEALVELARWADRSLNKLAIAKLKDEEAAGCLAAFLVNYNERRADSYTQLKRALLDAFTEQFIDGYSFVYAEGSERNELFQASMSAIASVVESPGSRFLGIRLKGFLEHELES